MRFFALIFVCYLLILVSAPMVCRMFVSILPSELCNNATCKKSESVTPLPLVNKSNTKKPSSSFNDDYTSESKCKKNIPYCPVTNCSNINCCVYIQEITNHDLKIPQKDLLRKIPSLHEGLTAGHIKGCWHPPENNCDS